MYEVLDLGWDSNGSGDSIVTDKENATRVAKVVNALRTTLESSSYNLPHLLFYGPPGTGKTSIISAVTKQLFGPLHNQPPATHGISTQRKAGETMFQ